MATVTASTAVDVLIIGGGPAGLSAALALARHLYHVIVFDNSQYRSDPSKHMHNVLTWDHQSPADFRRSAQANIEARYSTVQFKAKTVVTIRKTEGIFEAIDNDGTQYSGSKVVLAHGRRDVYPDIAGYSECWGTSIFHCLFCHGYEERDGDSAGLLTLGLLANADAVLHLASMARQLARSITAYTHGDSDLSASLRESIAGKPIQIEARKIVMLENLRGGGVKVHFEDGESKIEAFLAHMPDTRITGELHSQLGVEIEHQFGHPCVKTTGMFKETSIPGCCAVGDISSAISSVVGAMQAGALCAGALSAQLGSMKWF